MAAPDLPRIAAYRPTIVWGTGTGVDTSEFDDVGGYALGDPGLAIDGIGRDQIRAYSPPKAPALDLTLSNHDGRFSPGGPLALFLGRGPAVTVDADWGADVLVDSPDVLVDDPRALVDGAPSIRLFTGTSVDMPQQIDLGQYAVSVTAVGTLQSLVTTRPTTILYENIRTDEAIAVLLDAAGWDADARSLDTGDTQLLAWWLDGQTTAMDALNAILMAEGAGSCFYESGDGVAHFEGRQFRDSNASQHDRAVGVLRQRAVGQRARGLAGRARRLDGGAGRRAGQNALTYVAPSEYRSNPDEVVVSVAATVNTRTPTAVQQVWEYGGPLVLTSSQVLDVQVTASDPFKDAITPRDGTDYTITAGSALVGISLPDDERPGGHAQADGAVRRLHRRGRDLERHPGPGDQPAGRVVADRDLDAQYGAFDRASGLAEQPARAGLLAGDRAQSDARPRQLDGAALPEGAPPDHVQSRERRRDLPVRDVQHPAERSGAVRPRACAAQRRLLGGDRRLRDHARRADGHDARLRAGLRPQRRAVRRGPVRRRRIRDMMEA
jgi:hypothetical protein